MHVLAPLASHTLLDPLHLVHQKSRRNAAKDAAGDGSEKLMRERSIRSNRRQKFVDCVTGEDVSMGATITSIVPLDFVHNLSSATPQALMEWSTGRSSFYSLAIVACRVLYLESAASTNVSHRAIFHSQRHCEYLLWPANVPNTSTLSNSPLRGIGKASTNKYGIRLRSMSPGQGQVFVCGCTLQHNG